MRLSYDRIFGHSDILNPISSATLLSAAKLAGLEPTKAVLDLGSGKGFPSLFWASVFGVRVEGFDINKNFVGYANARAKMLNLSGRVKYSCEDIRELEFSRKYDVVTSLGLGIAQAYGSVPDALGIFKTALNEHGVLVLAEPVWLAKPVSSRVLKALGETEDSFGTKSEMKRLMRESGFQVLGHYASLREDWELYVRPVYVAMREIVETESGLADEARRVMTGFKAEYRAAGRQWDMILWVAKAQ